MIKKPPTADVQNRLPSPAALFQTWAETAPEIFFVVDPNLRLSYVNPFAARLLKKNPQALIGKHLKEIFPSEDFKIQRRNLKQVFATGSSHYHEDWLHFAGKALWLGIRLVPLRDPQGKINAVFGVARDNTTPKSLETALQENEKKYRGLVELIPGIVYIASGKTPGELLYVSPQIKNRLGFTPEEWLADWRLWLDHLHPDDRDRVLAAAALAAETGRPFLQEYRLIHRKGNVVWVYDQAYPVKDDAGRPLYFQGVNVDITRRKKAENDLAEEREKYQRLIDQAPFGVALLHKNRDFVYFNKKAIEILGYTLTEIPRHAAWLRRAYPDPAYRRQVLQTWTQDLKLGKTAVVPPRIFQVTCLDGNQKTIQFRLVEINREDQFVFFEDITQSRQAEEELTRTEERYRQVLENADEAILVIQDGWVKFCNPKSVEISGYSVKEQMGRPFIEFMAPNNRNLIMTNYARRVAGKKSPARYEIQFIHKDGRARFFQLNTRLITWDNRPASLVFATDITEKKLAQEALRESEGRYRSLFEASEDGVVITSEDGRILAINQACRRLFAIPKRANLKKLYVPDFYANPQDRTAYLRTMKQKGFVSNYEIAYRKTDGKTFTGTITATLQKDAADRPIFMGIIRDITQRKQHEQELRKSRRELRNLSEHLHILLEEQKKKISRRIHDELGQQLTALKMDLYWLNRHFSDHPPLLSDKIGSMSQVLDDTIHTVQNLCEELRPALLDNLGLIDALEWQINSFRQHTGLEILWNVSPRNLELAPEDATLIFRLFQETLNNIFHHARAGRVIIALKKVANLIKLTIRDDGRGITETQINNPRSFGLLGMRERVDARGGQIKIRGLAGKGTEVAIKIPLSKKEQRHD
jgi:PAS domain S-box-containing protein